MFQRSFRNLWFSQTCSNTADILYTIALITMMYQMSGSATYTALVPLCRTLSMSVSGMLAPLMVAKYRLTSLLLGSQAVQFGMFCVIALFAWKALAPHNVWVLLVLVVILSFFDGWTTPTRNALVPRLVPDDKLMKANGFLATTDQTVQFGGWAAGGVIAAAIGPPLTLGLTAVLYAVALAFTAMVRDPSASGRHAAEAAASLAGEGVIAPERRHRRDSGASSEGAAGGTPSRWETLREGWIALWRFRSLRAITLMDLIDGIGGSVWIGAFLLVFVQEVLHQGEEWWGFINAAYFVGAIGGGLFVVALVEKLERRLTLFMVAGTFGYGLCTLLFGLNVGLVPALLLTVLMGPMFQTRDIARKTMIQRSVSRDMLPKVLSAQATLSYGLFSLSVLAMGVVADTLGIGAMYVTAAICSFLSAGVGLLFRKAF